MKRMGLLAVLVIVISGSYAQTTAEWLQQKKTRIRYLVQQVAAFQMYLNDLKKGYRTVKNGLGVIDDIKHCDFDLHHDYFSSLSVVRANIKGNSKVQAIADLQVQTVSTSKAIRKLFASSFLLPCEQGYITATINNVMQKCLEDMDKLMTLTTSGKVQMKDKQRLDQINVLYQSAQDKYSFTVHLKQSTQLLLQLRMKEKTNASTIHSLYGLK